MNPDSEMPSYAPCGSSDWEYEPCLYGDLLLESRYLQTDGLYWNTEIGECAADVF